MGTAEYKRIGNVLQFIETQTRHSQALQQGGFIFDDPIPACLKPITQKIGPWPGADDMAWDFMHPDDEGRAISSEAKAPNAGFDTYQIVGKPGMEIAGHSYRVSPKTDFRNGGMPMEIARAKVLKPVREWNKSVARELFNILTADAFKATNAVRTDGYAWTIKDFEGNDVGVEKVTESATRATPTVAHPSHLVRWPDRQGGRFAAGHDHLPANAGGVWTEALGKTARDHIMEHPGATGVDAWVGKNVVDEIEAVVETARGSTESGVQYEKGGALEDDFGMPVFIAEHDNVRYFRLDCLPADLGVYLARGKKILGLSVGVQRADGDELPYAWNDVNLRDPETQAVNYGYRGIAVGHVINPVGVYVDRYTA